MRASLPLLRPLVALLLLLAFAALVAVVTPARDPQATAASRPQPAP